MDAGRGMCDDLPPPYSAIDDTKNNQLTGQLPGHGSFNPYDGQALPAYPSAPPGYETVAYYPALNSAGAAVLLQPSQQQQQQIVTITQPVQADAEEVGKTHGTDFCIMCCFCMCCSCPCLLVGFM